MYSKVTESLEINKKEEKLYLFLLLIYADVNLLNQFYTPFDKSAECFSLQHTI